MNDLCAVSELVLASLKSSGMEYVDLPEAWYWDIAEEQRFNMAAEPTGLPVGDLADDWQELTEILAGNHDPFGHTFVCLASILRTIGEKGLP